MKTTARVKALIMPPNWMISEHTGVIRQLLGTGIYHRHVQVLGRSFRQGIRRAQASCVSWAHNAGIVSIHPGVRKRAEYFRLRDAGIGRKEAAAAAGASRKSGYLWENEREQDTGRVSVPDTSCMP